MRLMFVAGFLAAMAAKPAAAAGPELVVCGWDEVFVLDVSRSSSEPRKVWSWRAADRPELPSAFRSRFSTTDECKPVAGNRILITASSDGVALVDRASRKTRFWAQCANAHSAELLPRERIVVACSVREPGGNRLAVFDAAEPERELFSTELYSGHGAVWDERRGTLWALGGSELRAYKLANWETGSPELRLVNTFPLPDAGGHDLVSVPRSSILALTTNRSVWLFDPDTGKFNPHPDLGNSVAVKSVAIHPGAAQIAYVQADRPEWWSATIRFLHPARTIHLPGQRLYKARWLQ
jgi:hypothetical protein